MIRPTGRPDKTTTTRRRGDRGLTTLEWLLIVAAVAGLAALAVVLVQNVVDDTAEQISGSSARLTAAQVAAEAINDDDDTDDDTKAAACRRLSITYSDAFAEDPGRTSLWTDSNTAADGDSAGGVCAVVTEEVATAIRKNTEADCDDASTGIVAKFDAADRGGKTVTFLANRTGDDCAFAVS